MKHIFERFKGSLYEDRWHEVLKFLAAIKKLLFVLARTWDADRYIRGVDLTGKSRPDQEAANERQEARGGLVQFNPKDLTRILNSSFFHYYVDMALLVEQVPEELASRAELCPCHGLLLERLSFYKRRVLSKSHFPSGCSTCPMVGQTLPEIVGVSLEEAQEIVWKTKSAQLHETRHVGESPLAAEE